MKNIVLIGMSGAGKTTVGMELSRILNREFFDTDYLIEKEENLSIEDIFSTYGESCFRKLECTIIDKLSQYEDVIISTGGGIVVDNKNISNLKEKGIIVLLESSVDNIVNNLKNSQIKRPLLGSGEDIFAKVNSMYNSRKDIYIAASDFTILVDNKSIEEIIYEILERCVKINS
ncbi:shikimate kinase [Tissierella sp.]|uniref:shikimate kinase n=1 Tax=Tissierella sp. TaxID=41274 RepID=UPI002856C030|nr:shikimate kinase [Tissierella sp.]MDR7856134.1 shikimate kinase [Tissierella sp.]